MQASLEQKQRLQSLFFPEGLTFDGTAFNRTNVTGCAFSYLERSEAGRYEMVALTFASWNLISGWLTRLDALRRAA